MKKHFGKTGFEVSPFGFGCYRIDDRVHTHKEALKFALQSGVNLIDTSSNYTDGQSEKCVGQVLGELFANKTLKREDVCVVTKAGYLQGQNLSVALQKEKAGSPYTDVVKVGRDLWHCISPDFLNDQISFSLERLKLKSLDVFLLHNPEYFFKTSNDQNEYYKRIQKAFEFLESEVKKGTIKWYGISSNTFVVSESAKDFTSLQKCIEIASAISPKNHFAVVQCPFNVFESGAMLEKNNEGSSVFELAQKHNLGVLTNRPLNAFVRQSMIRLSDFTFHAQVNEKRFEESLQHAVHFEKKFFEYELQGFKPLMLGHVLSAEGTQIENFLHWKEVFQYQIEPMLKQSFLGLEQFPELKNWSQTYRLVEVDLVEQFSNLLENRLAEKSEAISLALTTRVPILNKHATLSQQVLKLYQSIEAITCTLVGMREEKYVKDVLQTLDTSPLDDTQSKLVFEYFQSLKV